jgi:hypothetical protein
LIQQKNRPGLFCLGGLKHFSFSSAQAFPEPNLYGSDQDGIVSSLPLFVPATVMRTAGLAQFVTGWACCPLCQRSVMVMEANIVMILLGGDKPLVIHLRVFYHSF